MVDFASLADTAKRLIEANGRSITLYRRDRTPANAAQPWRGPDSTPTPPDGVSITVTAAFVPPRGSELGKILADKDGTLRRRVDQVCLIATDSVVAEGFTDADVERCDSISDDSKAWKIVLVENLKPAGQSVLLVLGVVS